MKSKTLAQPSYTYLMIFGPHMLAHCNSTSLKARIRHHCQAHVDEANMLITYTCWIATQERKRAVQHDADTPHHATPPGFNTIWFALLGYAKNYPGKAELKVRLNKNGLLWR
jgi:hypothetical protein